MIRNLNQLTFQGFGTVPPERSQSTRYMDRSCAEVWKLTDGDGDVCVAKADTWVTFGAGMSVLSASLDGVSFQHYYLDKPVCIRENTYFVLSAFQGEATALVQSPVSPERTGERTCQNLHVTHEVRVDRIYTFFYHEKEQGFLFPGESHPMIELTYVDQGTLHSVVNGQDLVLKQGDMVIYGPDQWHMQYADIGVSPGFITLTFDLNGVDITPMLNRRFSAPQQLAALLKQMLREQERMEPFASDMLIAQLTQVVVLLLREAAAPSGAKLQTSNAVHNENEIVRQAQQYVSAHIREKLSVPLLAKQVDVSPSYLTALFHKNLQISPGEYIRRSKLQESKQMIRENDLNFTEIAAALQYSTVHHFSRQFKEKFGITPTEYAKSVR